MPADGNARCADSVSLVLKCEMPVDKTSENLSRFQAAKLTIDKSWFHPEYPASRTLREGTATSLRLVCFKIKQKKKS